MIDRPAEGTETLAQGLGKGSRCRLVLGGEPGDTGDQRENVADAMAHVAIAALLVVARTPALAHVTRDRDEPRHCAAAAHRHDHDVEQSRAAAGPGDRGAADL